MKKFIVVAITLATVFTSSYNMENIKANEHDVYKTEDIQLKKEKKVWKYKIINGRLYKRLFNESRNRWETDWIAV